MMHNLFISLSSDNDVFWTYFLSNYSVSIHLVMFVHTNLLLFVDLLVNLYKLKMGWVWSAWMLVCYKKKIDSILHYLEML